jgi:hypothetical protein
MTTTWDIIRAEAPKSLPYLTTILTYASVDEITHVEEDQGFMILRGYPKWFSSPLVYRKMAIAEEQNPNLPFDYFLAGKMEVNGKTANIFLEKSR